ncbi:MAG TPA: GtrA family protein [Gaiellaceae bacterium]|nr:GtrA family protein [Gaiellaceae bacterium]
MDAIVNRAVGALKLRSNWIQLAKFGVVGASGYAINLVAYTLLLGLGAHSAAAISFILAATSNYWWNRHWTFVETKGHFGYQGLRFLAVSAVALIANQIWLVVFLDWFGWGKVISQALALALVVPLNFLGNKLWSFRG